MKPTNPTNPKTELLAKKLKQRLPNRQERPSSSRGLGNAVFRSRSGGIYIICECVSFSKFLTSYLLPTGDLFLELGKKVEQVKGVCFANIWEQQSFSYRG